MRLWIVSGRMECKKEDTPVIVNHRNSFIIDLLTYSPHTIQTSHWSLQNSSTSRYKTIVLVSMGSKMCKKWKHGFFFFLILLKTTFGSHTHTHILSFSLSIYIFIFITFLKGRVGITQAFFRNPEKFPLFSFFFRNFSLRNFIFLLLFRSLNF